MKPIPYRVQLRLVAAGYAAVLAIAVALIVARYLQYVLHPQDADAYAGMWAGGDMMLELFICFLLMIHRVSGVRHPKIRDRHRDVCESPIRLQLDGAA